MPADDSRYRRPRPFQFGIGTILLLTTVGGLILGLARMLDATPAVTVGICLYFFLLAVYFLMRVPYLLRTAFGKDSPWQQLQQERQEFDAAYRRFKETSQSDEGDADATEKLSD